MTGECKLCGGSHILQDSHLMPKAIYRILGRYGGGSVNDLVLVDSRSKKAFKTSRQHRAKLLCLNCELKLNRGGENHVLRNMPQKNQTFPLRDKLFATKGSALDKRGYRTWRPKEVNLGIDSNKFLHFAAGVFWKYNVVDIKGYGSVYRRALGSYYEERFRRYLLGSGTLPKKLMLQIGIDTEYEPIGSMMPPCRFVHELRGVRTTRHVFHVPGLTFNLWLGGNSGEISKSANGNITFHETPFKGIGLYKDLASMAQEATAVGKLANE